MTTQPDITSNKSTIVLVHGAFADATGWQHVIPLLEQAGHFVVAVQNPLTSLEDDLNATRRVIEAQHEPIILVGHSYGGAVISGAFTGNATVQALVYIAAFAPDAGEPIGAYSEQYASELGAMLRPDSAGFVTIDRSHFKEIFAGDVSETEAGIMAATQKPIKGDVFSAATTHAAWKTIPSWFMVATEDRTINPDLQRYYAKRMNATIEEVNSSHVPFISHPEAVVRMIETAALAAVSEHESGARNILVGSKAAG